MRAILIALLVLASVGPANAQPTQNPLPYVQSGQWAQAQLLANQTGDPVAEKLIVFVRMLTPNAAGDAEIADFMRANPEWPLAAVLERRRQEAIAVDLDNATVAALCMEKKPTPSPARGPAMMRCADALANIGRGKEAGIFAREAWVSAISDPATESAFIQRFPGLISAADQWARFQRLAWDDVVGAQRQIAYLDPTLVAKATGRLALKSNVLGYTARPEDEPGAMLDLARAYRKLEQNQDATALWRASGAAAQKAAPEHLDAFWTERHFLARKLLHAGDPGNAFLVVSEHGQADPQVMAEAEFLAGFIALRRLNDPRSAKTHFTALAAASPSVLTQSRAYYWLGRTSAASGGDGRSEYARAAAWPTTFYGQLAVRAGGQADTNLIQILRAGPTPSTGLQATPLNTELTRAANQLLVWGDPKRARLFLIRLEELARTPGERIAVGDRATAMGLPDIAVLVARRLGRDGVTPPMQGWPVPFEPPPDPEPAVSLAIMRQESNFDPEIVSSSGARGLMQLMPGTAQTVARHVGEATSVALLTNDPAHNMRMGTAYLSEMLTKFDNSVPLSAAAYNAGPNRVTQWLTDNGDPRVGDQSMIDWIEMIPFNETRNYVQRVLESIVVYQARRSGTLPAVMAQWSR